MNNVINLTGTQSCQEAELLDKYGQSHELIWMTRGLFAQVKSFKLMTERSSRRSLSRNTIPPLPARTEKAMVPKLDLWLLQKNMQDGGRETLNYVVVSELERWDVM